METLPAVRDLDHDERVGHWLALSESGNQTPAALAASAALRIYFARELGLPPLAAAELSVIKGRLFVQAKLLRALAAQHGYRVLRTDSSETSCTAVLEKDGSEVGRSTFTIQDAKRAGLIRDRSAWQTHPARMLWARASKYVLDDYAPEITLGLSTDDELAEIIEAEIIEEPKQQRRPRRANETKRQQMFDLMRDDVGIPEQRELRLAYVAQVIGHPVESSAELTAGEVAMVIDHLEQLKRMDVTERVQVLDQMLSPQSEPEPDPQLERIPFGDDAA